MAGRNVPALKNALIVVHRYVGLTISVFLILAGVTGSLLAFYPQIDRLLNPALLSVAPPHAEAQLLDPFVARERLNAQLPEGKRVDGVVLFRPHDFPYNYWIDGKEVFVDPYTGSIRGARTFGDVTEGKKSLMTFIYEFHFSLGLGEVGSWIFGIVALLWTLDCFVGAYLTFPPPRRSRASTPQSIWILRWMPAWFLKTYKLFSLVFTWHRASGLWLFGFLLVFAWSAVALNLRDEVYEPTMSVLFDPEQDIHDRLPHLDPPRETPRLSLREAYDTARVQMKEAASSRGFEVLGEQYLSYDAEHGTYAYTVETDRDVSSRLAETTLYLDGDTGRAVALHLPDSSQAGSTITRWLIALHFGAVRLGGMPYRVFVCVLGVLVALLSITGIWIWYRKWSKRRGAARS